VVAELGWHKSERRTEIEIEMKPRKRVYVIYDPLM
jgi:hypothetical protein